MKMSCRQSLALGGALSLLLSAQAAPTGCTGPNLSALTPTQDAQLACLATTAAQGLAATYANPVKNAQYQADGSLLCTLATGAAIVVTAPKAQAPARYLPERRLPGLGRPPAGVVAPPLSLPSPRA